MASAALNGMWRSSISNALAWRQHIIIASPRQHGGAWRQHRA